MFTASGCSSICLRKYYAALFYACSTHHLSLAILPVISPDDPNLPDIRSELAIFAV